MRSLHQCLLDADLPHLRAMARFWDLDLPSGRQRDAAAQLAEAMSAPETIASACEALPDDQRRALETLLASGGRMPLRVFAREWGEIRTMGPGRMEREQPWREPISPAEGLWYSGLISRAFEQGAEGAYEAVFIPPELRAHLPTPAAPSPAIALEPAPEPTETRSSGDALLDDACTLLAYLQNERLRPDPGGDWPARHEARLSRRLRDPDPARLAFLRHLVQHIGWLKATQSGRPRPDPEPVTAWLQSPIGEQRNALAQAWRDDVAWNDLFHTPTLRPEDTGAWRNDPLLAREAILRGLKTCAPDTWYALGDFVAAIKQTDPDFQRPDGDYTTWYIRDAISGAYLSGFESWEAVEGALISYIVAGPLHWLGLTDLDSCLLPPATCSPSATFRLTPAGAAFLGLTEPTPEPDPAPLTLRSDFTVQSPPARRYERFQLSRVADWASSPHVGGTERDNDSFIYRLTPTSLERARRQGIPVARVLEFLAEVTGAPVPRFVEAALTRCDARGAEAQIERAMLLRLASEELMTQVASSPPTRALIHEQIGPTAALVRKRDWPRLIVALGEMGLLPDVGQVVNLPRQKTLKVF
ncbi:MAG: helicase-associated domain-containing protein [Chloroflexota bacterium]|nr:helicase-associated domain-containing protein [Chloroflexota bacterium]